MVARKSNRPLQAAGAGECGCLRPDLTHERGCRWRLDRRPGRGPKLTLSERVAQLEALVIALQVRVTQLEATAGPAPTTSPEAPAGGGSR